MEEIRPLILWCETAALLHDVGKLSADFYSYRQRWRSRKMKDPHVDAFFENHDKEIAKYPVLKTIFFEDHDVPKGLSREPKPVSIKTFVHEHIETSDHLTNLLKIADSIDAATDRNNPLFSAEQSLTKDNGSVYMTDVFGDEIDRRLEPKSADEERRSLYDKLKEHLPNYFTTYGYEDRKLLLQNLQDAFSTGLSDTTRPQNDTTLWEHSYAVATIFKALLAHAILNEKDLASYTFPNARFGLLGFGWDGLGFLSRGHKIGDVIGRKKQIDDLCKKIRKVIEYRYPIGNTVYNDDNGIYFLIPSLPEDVMFEPSNLSEHGTYGLLLQKIREEALNLSLETAHGDLVPQMAMVENTRFMTRIVDCIRKVKEKTRVPLNGAPKPLLDAICQPWTDVIGREVCPLCRRRPVKDGLDICDPCNRNRVRSFRRRPKEAPPMESPFIREIVAANQKEGMKKRAALIVAKFDLSRWLDGTMMRTLFVTEAKGLERELGALGKGEVEPDKNLETDMKRYLKTGPRGNLIEQRYNYERILNEIDLCFRYADLSEEEKEYAEHTHYLYYRRWLEEGLDFGMRFREIRKRWDSFLKSAREEYKGKTDLYDQALLVNILCAKTPTPSSLLNVWNTTKVFFEALRRETDGGILLQGKAQRIRAIVKKPKNGVKVIHRAAYEGRIGETPIEVLWTDESSDEALIICLPYDKAEIQKWENSTIVLKGKPFERKRDLPVGKPTGIEPDAYYPVRIITATPDTFMAIVPAEKAPAITEWIYTDYTKHFGKVMGRLPLSIGNIFFPEKMPMFVVLDSARRMIANFEGLSQQKFSCRACGKAEDVSDNGKKERCQFQLDSLSIDDGTVISERKWTWTLPNRLATGEPDYHHPYFIVDPKGRDHSKQCDNFFETVAGPVIHVEEIEAGDRLLIYPNIYDFERLDSTSRRFDIDLPKEKRRPGLSGMASKPYLLDELEQGLHKLWEDMGKLMPGVTDAKIRNIETLWLEKLKTWNVNPRDRESEPFKRWAALVETTLQKEFAGYRGSSDKDKEGFERLKEAVFSGLFFDCLELNLRILKNRIKEVKRA